jgi:Cu+-exporting ATPase
MDLQGDPSLKKSATAPICGTHVEMAGAKHFSIREGLQYFFCSRSCHERFQADPKRFVSSLFCR